MSIVESKLTKKRSKYRITKQPENFSLLSNHVDWTARFGGKINDCKLALKNKTVELPPEGAYIKSNRTGHYSLISYHDAQNHSVVELVEEFGNIAEDTSGRAALQDSDNKNESKHTTDQPILLAVLEQCGLDNPVHMPWYYVNHITVNSKYFLSILGSDKDFRATWSGRVGWRSACQHHFPRAPCNGRSGAPMRAHLDSILKHGIRDSPQTTVVSTIGMPYF